MVIHRLALTLHPATLLKAALRAVFNNVAVLLKVS